MKGAVHFCTTQTQKFPIFDKQNAGLHYFKGSSKKALIQSASNTQPSAQLNHSQPNLSDSYFSLTNNATKNAIRCYSPHKRIYSNHWAIYYC
jgi:hypothetical protein